MCRSTKWTTGIAVVVTVLALATAAAAKFSQGATIALTTRQAGQSTGLASTIRAADPAAPGYKPKSLKTLAIAFPAGTSFNLATPLVGSCTLTDKQLMTPFGPTCPSNSQIATGTAAFNMSPVGPPFTTTGTATAYVAGSSQILIEIVPKLPPGHAPIIIHGTVTGSTLTLNVPQTWLGHDWVLIPGALKKTWFPGVKMVLTSLKLSAPALGSGSNALIIAGRCTSHKFVVKEHFVYSDHSSLNLVSRSACS